jgi:hypothetical protein
VRSRALTISSHSRHHPVAFAGSKTHPHNSQQSGGACRSGTAVLEAAGSPANGSLG